MTGKPFVEDYRTPLTISNMKKITSSPLLINVSFLRIYFNCLFHLCCDFLVNETVQASIEIEARNKALNGELELALSEKKKLEENCKISFILISTLKSRADKY